MINSIGMETLQKQPIFSFRPCACAALGTLCGMLLFAALPGPFLRAYAVALLLLAALSALFRLRGWMLVLSFFALSLLWGDARRIDEPVTGVHTVTGRICDLPEEKGIGVYAFTLERVSVDGVALRGRVALKTRAKTPPLYGQTVRARCSLYAPYGNTRANYTYRRVFCIAESNDLIMLSDAPRASLYGALLSLRQSLSARIEALFPEGGGAASAMLLGDKQSMDGELLAAYRDSGLSHLLAVSGLHATMLAGAFSALLRRGSWRKFLGTAAFLLLYCALTAFSPSVLRASVMLLLMLLARPLRKPPDRLSALSAAFVIVLFCNPYALFYAGFQLSFLAAFGLCTLSPVLTGRLAPLGSRTAYAVSGTLSACAATLPAQAAFFSGFPLMGLVASLFAIPVLPFFLLPGLLLTLLSYLSFPLADALAFLPRLALSAINALSAYCAGTTLTLAPPPMLAVLLYAAALLCFPACTEKARRQDV